MSDNSYEARQWTTIKALEYDPWRVQIVPGTYWTMQKGETPNAFHRLMQRLILGFVWERVK